MKKIFIRTIAGVSIGLLSSVAVPAYGGSGRAGGGHAGFSGGAHFSGASRGYSGAGMSRPAAGSCTPRSYSSGISAGRSGQRYHTPRTSTGSQTYSTLARPQSRTASGQFTRSPNYSGSYYVPRDQSKVGFANRRALQERDGVSAKGAALPNRAWSRQNAANRQRLDPQTKERLRNWQGTAPGYADAKRRQEEQWRNPHRHDHDWWRHNCTAIVFVGGGFWGWYDGWWYPAWGYDPDYSYYDYNGPIYGYGGLQPDEIIADVQSVLQQLGYYPYGVDGILGPASETAIANYQRDYGLSVTGAIDPPTVRSLGLSG